MKKAYFLISIFLLSFNLMASDSISEVRGHLNNLSGCFKVQYQFVEDGYFDKTYAPILEWIRKSEDSRETVLEHIGMYPMSEKLSVEDENQEFYVQYHWREHWRHQGLGKYRTFIYGPYVNSPKRYDCEGYWIKGQFECTARAMKPRRHEKRDYDYLMRTNMLQVNNKRWIQSEKNLLMRESGDILASELGWITYNRVDDKFCQKAIDEHPMPF